MRIRRATCFTHSSSPTVSDTGSPTSGWPSRPARRRSERQRSAEIESSAELLRTISGVLDIRTVFPRVSEIAKKMLPHDALAMVFVDQDRHFVRQAHVAR